MKKIIAIVLALATVFTFSATAFAAPSGRINKAQAKQIALDHAGFTENEVRFTKAKLDFDDGIFEYDIEFFVGRVEYDYTIAAADGRIIEFDIDGKEPAAPADIITKDEAKAIALRHAGVAESEARFTKVELDYDDGAYEYDVEFTANNTEYDYTVVAADGRIIKFETENKTPVTVPTDIITKDEAKAIALGHAGVAESEARFTKVELDYDDGAYEYEVEFTANNTEYDYTVAAADGRIIKFETENKTPVTVPTDIITEGDAKAIALRHAGLTESEVRFTKVELDYDDGAYEYDIEFVAGNTEYDYTVNAANGKIVDFDREPVEHHFSLSVLVRWIKDFFAAIFG